MPGAQMTSGMHWRPLPRGGFTGIDWSRPGATAGFDPYLVWAEADGFAAYGDQPPKWLPVAIELASGVGIADFIASASPAWLRVPPVYSSAAAPAGLRFCTARVRPAFFRQLAPGGSLHARVKRVELGLPAGMHTDEPPQDGPVATAGPLLKGKVLGLIDDSLAFAHANFLRDGKARTRHFWRQDGKGIGATPAALGYGHELDGATIDEAIRRHTYNGLVDEGAVYQAFDLFRLQKPASHGTHVLDLAGGPRTLQAQVGGPDRPPSWAPAGDAASRAAIVAVQLDWDAVRDTSGGSLNVHVLDALMYILSRCHADARVTVNLSWGTLAGPHNGSALIEAAMDQLIALRGDRLQIALPAGNSYQARAHANATLKKNAHVDLHWVGQPDDRTQSFLELWLDEGHEGIEIIVTPPGRTALPPLRFGESGIWSEDGGMPQLALIYPTRVATGERGTCALLAIAPSFSFEAGATTAPSGVWTVRISNQAAAPATFDAYIQRDDDPLGLATGARQSFFEDRFYDTSGNPGSFVDDPDNPTPIRRSGSFNSIATGARTVSTGGTRLADGSWARYSPRRPDPDAARPARAGVVKLPDAEAASDENNTLTGVRAAGTRSGAVLRLRGTSDAAPQQARRLLNAS